MLLDPQGQAYFAEEIDAAELKSVDSEVENPFLHSSEPLTPKSARSFNFKAQRADKLSGPRGRKLYSDTSDYGV